MIQKIIHNKLIEAIDKAVQNGDLPHFEGEVIHQVSTPRHEAHGDYASNVAMSMAKAFKMPPKKTGEILKAILSEDPLFSRIDVAGPGFLNFFISDSYWQGHLKTLISDGDNYGRCDIGRGISVLLEYVSANPTGPLHVGHGRGAAIGDTIRRLLKFAGFDVKTEYYINDAGNQMKMLGKSVLIRYLNACGRSMTFPDGLYRGDYIKDIALKAQDIYGDKFIDSSTDDSEVITIFSELAVNEILEGIKADLKGFNCAFDNWFSEKKGLHDTGFINEVIEDMQKRGLVYEKDGALWFRSSEWGDEKDRVVRRSTGENTYFAADIAYHIHKIKRGYRLLIDIWGADHHGYVPRLKGALSAIGLKADSLSVLLVQFVNLLEDGQLKGMSTRAGEFITLKELIDDVGRDAARFMFLTKRSDTHLDFDLDIVKKQGQENPVYYVQYAHARLSSVFKKARERGINIDDISPDAIDCSLLSKGEEIDILKALEAFQKTIEGAASNLEPHNISYYLTDLASRLHSYYNKYRFLTDDKDLSFARLFLAKGVRQVIKNGLSILGVSAPDNM